MLIGAILVLQAIRGIGALEDVLMLLGAPIVTNGISLFLSGALLCGLAEVIGLLNRIAKK